MKITSFFYILFFLCLVACSQQANVPSNLEPEMPKQPESSPEQSEIWNHNSPHNPKLKELIDSGTLYNGMTIKEAEAILGPATEKTNSLIEWYHNPYGYHVAPYLRAELQNEKTL